MGKMRRFAAKFLFLMVTSAMMLTITAAAADYGTVDASALRLRAEASLESDILTLIPDGTKVELLGEEGDWFKTSYGGKTGFVSKEFVLVADETAEEETTEETAASTAASQQNIKQEIVDKSCTYIGTPYKYGGASPSGFDCSGFTMYIYKQFGYSLPHSATAQMSKGERVSKDELQMGDLVFFLDTRYASSGASHVGLYIGGGKFIHAPNSSTPVSIDSVTDGGYWCNTYIGAARIVAN